MVRILEKKGLPTGDDIRLTIPKLPTFWLAIYRFFVEKLVKNELLNQSNPSAIIRDGTF